MRNGNNKGFGARDSRVQILVSYFQADLLWANLNFSKLQISRLYNETNTTCSHARCADAVM